MAWLKKNSKIAPINNNESVGNHAKINKVNPYDFQATFKRLAWLLQISMFANIGFIITIMALGMALYQAYPLKRTEIALVERVPASDQLLRIQPLSKDIDGFQLLMESVSKRFVKNLLEIDNITQKARFDEVFPMMDSKPFKEFKESRLDNHALDDFIKSGLIRNINVESCDALAGLSYGVYKFSCELTQIDTKQINKVEVSRKNLRAYIAFVLRPNDVLEKDKYQNPLGIFVIEFSLKERF